MTRSEEELKALVTRDIKAKKDDAALSIPHVMRVANFMFEASNHGMMQMSVSVSHTCIVHVKVRISNSKSIF
jgi:hypothetical protein